MADEKQSGGNGLIVLVVAAVSAAYFTWQKPQLEGFTGSPEAVARPRFPQNVACGFPAPTLFGSCFTALRCYLFKFRFHGQLIFSLNRRPCLPLNGAHVAQEQFNYR